MLPITPALFLLSAYSPLPPTPAVELERELNESAFDQQYLPHKEALFAEERTGWLVIAGGSLYPNFSGRPAPAATWEQAVAAAETHAPDALHRFVWRVGEEGTLSYRATISEREGWLGTQFMGLLPGNVWITPDSVLLAPSGMSSPRDGDIPSPVRRLGPGDVGDGPSIELRWSSLDGSEQPLERSPVLATGFSGVALLSAADADELGLARWEIPGAVQLGHPDHLLHRARVQVEVPGCEFTRWVPVAVRLEVD